MNRLVSTVLIVLVVCYTSLASAADHPLFSSTQQQCYAMAMMGKDSVINARLGVPPEHVLELTRVSNNARDAEVQFDNATLDVMLAAYLWEGTPQSYATSVYHDCALRH